jgi:WD40 repeat protein
MELANPTVIRLQHAAQCLAFSGDSRRVAGGNGQGEIWVWPVGTAADALRRLAVSPAAVQRLLWLPDNRLLSGDADGAVRSWDPFAGECRLTLLGHQGPVTALTAVEATGRIVSGSADASRRLWNLKTGACDKVFQPHPAVLDMDGLIDGSTGEFSYHSLDGGLEYGRTRDSRGQCHGHAGPITAVATVRGGHAIVSASEDHTLRWWDLRRGVCQGIFGGQAVRGLGSWRGRVISPLRRGAHRGPPVAVRRDVGDGRSRSSRRASGVHQRADLGDGA